ncbi:hypothetical protein B0H14DRAFT_3709450 [Mycena olivaceomarginata]|nr:hypothetical protein B0H14DRAFT_3709450 [Mycena olivaceomarginata]
MYLPTCVGVSGFNDHGSLSRAVVGRRRASAPALPHCGAGGSMTNVRGRDGTSDGAGRLQLGTVHPPWRHCWCARSANECHPEALVNAAVPARERLFSRFASAGEQAGRLRRGHNGEVSQGARALEPQRGNTGCATSRAGGAAVHDWSIAEALPGAAAHEEMYIYTSLGLNGAWTSAALEARRPVDTFQHAAGCMNAQSPSSTPTLRPHVSEPQAFGIGFLLEAARVVDVRIKPASTVADETRRLAHADQQCRSVRISPGGGTSFRLSFEKERKLQECLVSFVGSENRETNVSAPPIE